MLKYLFALSLLPFTSFGQDTLFHKLASRHSITSQALGETRDYWVSLPLGYTDSLRYPVVYVFDAEWRFDLVRHMAFDLGGNRLIDRSIIVGIPHIEWEFQRSKDLTFSESRMEYDGTPVDSSWYNAKNAGGADQFYAYLRDELMEDVNSRYATNGHETLIGHSLGGYFGAYLLSLEHPFEVIHMYDPSIWYGNGEVSERFKAASGSQKKVKVHLTYQPEPAFHRQKIEELIGLLEADENITLSTQFYPDYTHNALFLDSFYQGIRQTHTVQP